MRNRALKHAINQAKRAQIDAQGGYEAVERDAHGHDRFLANRAIKHPIYVPPLPERLGSRTKLTRVHLEQARAMRAQGLSYPKIALQFGVDHSTIMYWLDPGQRRRRYALNQKTTLRSVA